MGCVVEGHFSLVLDGPFGKGYRLGQHVSETFHRIKREALV